MNHQIENKDKLLHLDQQVCFTIYACSREIIQLYRPFLKELDLTYSQYLVMLVLWEHKKVTMSELGRYLYLDNGTLTPLIKRLIIAGLVQKKRSSEDERVVHITLTEDGLTLREKAYEIPNSIMPLLTKDPSIKDKIENLLSIIQSENEKKS
ncbi:MarR family winged helix-turn-helix transcriptional regulator [Bacillus sp. AFS040349]|uniref:MarR family winged helix-turn-helix transcriptional regulator n=1 Tax=Bacillus sp. AFS040349 TaxID=2033502 RepID=UPI000BFBB476|nr:MarR family transcriptional regulator [Bacillus sp. AFS040349]PGT77939.1 MarR family transcriptional regulator [Bacillus sp. AFS040349]